MAKHDSGWDIALGMDVVDPAGEKVGEVKHVQRHHVVVEKGWLFHTDYEIPLAKVTGVDSVVHLSITKESLQHGGWDEGPSEVRRDGGSINADPTDSIGLPE
jgi:hypothetical protein